MDDEDLLPDYLRDLAERLMRVPVMYGVDGRDVDRLNELAGGLEAAGIDYIEAI